MATPQLSPGILVREVDLTVGRADNVLDNIGAIAGPFRLGPIDTPIQVSNEEELISNFGKPLSTDRQYEYWMSAASFLSYGGVLKVVRADDDDLGNANAGVGIASTTVIGGSGGLKIESLMIIKRTTPLIPHSTMLLSFPDHGQTESRFVK